MPASTRSGAAHPVGIAAATVVLALAVSGCSSGGGHPSGGAGRPASGATLTVTPSPSGATGPGLTRTVVVGVDLPFKGFWAETSNATYNAMQIYLDSVGDKAGPYTIRLRKYDQDADATNGVWSPQACRANANAHAAAQDEVAVMGTFASDCAMVEVPILNRAPGGPLLMVSGGDSNPALTKPWVGGTPARYYPTGHRSYARVIPTDDYQATLAARFAARTLHVRRCYVLHDDTDYGDGLAAAFRQAAAVEGTTIVGYRSWFGGPALYTTLFQQIRSTHPDCLYLGGFFANDGAQLLHDKLAVLGDNTAVKVIAPDRFTGYTQEDELAASQGMYMTLAGKTEQLTRAQGSGPRAALLARYQRRYGSPPPSGYVIYGVQALQVILAAIARSDGSRAGVTAAVLGGTGVTIPAAVAVLGSDVKIDPVTGDVNVVDVTFLRMRNHRESYLTSLAGP